jgi:hypothetical protein
VIALHARFQQLAALRVQNWLDSGEPAYPYRCTAASSDDVLNIVVYSNRAHEILVRPMTTILAQRHRR